MVWKNTSINRLWKVIQRILFHLFGNVKHARIFIMSKTATIVYTDPTTKFTGVEVAMRVAGAPDFTIIANIAPGIQKDVIPDLVDGDYEFRLVALNGVLRSSEVLLTGTVSTPPVDVAPDAVTGASVTFA
jgi:hypothetical protein